MIKYIFGISIFLFSGLLHAQVIITIQWQTAGTANSGDTIHYNPEKKLSWDDFKGTPDQSSVAAAITESGFGYRVSMQSNNKKTEINITVFCYFGKMNSWVKPNLKSEYALLHEQHHFDITYINACLFIRKLRASHITLQNFASLVEKINDECYSDMGKMQDDYDGQTKNGRVKNIQLIWNKKIDQQLESLITN
ncbi:MAG: hypothetical protein ABI666_05500 [Ferruginibacter sp.]